MPLKDLAVDTAQLAEKQIEDIVAQYVKYDVKNKRIVLLPEAAHLPVAMKVLVYLVALRGWPFVTDEKEVALSATPARIGEELNIRSGTVRPALKELKDANYVSAQGRSYTVQLAALSSIEQEVNRRASGRAGGPDKSKGSRSSTKKKSSKSAGRFSGMASAGNTELFDREIARGFFDEPKTLADVVKRFHENGRIVQQGVVSPLLLNAVKKEKLQRRKAKVNGKEVWVYERIK